MRHAGKFGQFATPLAATNDPLFWPTHSAWGRFWAFVRVAPEYLESFDYKWDNSSTDDCENMFNYHDKLPFKKVTHKLKAEAMCLSAAHCLVLSIPSWPREPRN